MYEVNLSANILLSGILFVLFGLRFMDDLSSRPSEVTIEDLYKGDTVETMMRLGVSLMILSFFLPS